MAYKRLCTQSRAEQEEYRVSYRRRFLPSQLERARSRYLHLRTEAIRLEMQDLLTPEEISACSQ